MAAITIEQFSTDLEKEWDRFVLKESTNGTFLQSRNFLNYHPEGRFKDASLVVKKGNAIVAVIPANREGQSIISHRGSTFGGVVLEKHALKVSVLENIFKALNDYCVENSINEIVLKQTGNIFCKEDTSLLDYFLFLNGYEVSYELGYWIDYTDYPEDIISAFSSSRRRDYRYSLKSDFRFGELTSDQDISEFYDILCDNYTKFGKNPVHTLAELIEFKKSRLKDIVRFFGVFEENQMIAGGMTFSFDHRVIHTQYLAVRQDKTNFFANEFLYTNLIKTGKEDGFEKFSFGTSTLESGKVLNKPLAQFKEGFGTQTFLNITYRKKF